MRHGSPSTSHPSIQYFQSWVSSEKECILKITDGNGTVILDDERSLLKEEPVKQSSSTAPGVNGFFGGGYNGTSSAPVVSTTGLNLN
ncbi:MAG: hypothetical protein LEGION0403_FIIPPAGN_02378 [Legionella sp.]|uniref:hypothetical protein n=1 Tax=Legionella sp. TaxID=459 RepID=UPI003D0E22F7